MEQTVAREPSARTLDDLLTPLFLVVLVTGTIVFLWAAGSASQVYLGVHVLASVVWVGGGAVLTVFALRTQRTRDPHALGNLMRQVEFIGLRVFTPASLVTLGFGIAVVEEYGLGYGSFWIDFALAVWAFSFVLGSAFIGPRTGKLHRLIDERGVEDPVVQRGIAQVLRLARLDVTMLLLVVVDMAVKPSF